jgi:penicillin amidase
MRRVLKIGSLVAVFLVLVGLIWVRAVVRGPLPTLDGKLEISDLQHNVTIERDAQGVPRILAANSLDAVRALGFLHGQERFFQMDLLRRRSAGELSALFGAAAIDTDRRVRVHRLRSRAEANVAAADKTSRRELMAYTEGVNAGLEGTGRPLEYILMRAQPEPWRAEDSMLAVYTMYLNLQDENGRLDSARGLMRDTLPPAAVDFLLPQGSEWDAPLLGDAFETSPIPGPEHWNLRLNAEAAQVPPTRKNVDETAEALRLVGSNNWAVSGQRSADGRAMVANDMHLGLGLPNIWYRASIQWNDVDDATRRVSGVTLPGVMGVVAGSSDAIAWGFTNSQGDWTDLVEVQFVDGSDTHYRTPLGDTEIEIFQETIAVAGGEDQTLQVRETIWGPLVDVDHRGTPRAVRWIAHDTDGVNMSLARMAQAESLEDAFRLAHRSGIPAQNFVAAGTDGRIGWTLVGPMPNRVGYDGRFPESWADGTMGWDGRVAEVDVPQILDPPSGLLWTANNRTTEGIDMQRIGDGGWADGARAKQIRDGLMALKAVTPQDMLALQLDDRALFLERWKDRLLELLVDETKLRADPRLEELQRQLESTWSGHASIDSVAYRMVRAWRGYVATRVFEPLTAACQAADENFTYTFTARFEGPLWRILEERPQHLLDPAYPDWNALLLAAADDLLDHFLQDGVDTLDRFTWGDRNQATVAHPMSRSLPGFIKKFFDLPTEALPGDSSMPRVQGVGFGASERFVVAPGDQTAGLFHMPGGQSGHPLSPYYSAGHRAWADGTAAPFLPGETRHTLVLIPAP